LEYAALTLTMDARGMQQGGDISKRALDGVTVSAGKAEEAVKGVKEELDGLKKPTEEAGDALKETGENADETTSSFSKLGEMAGTTLGNKFRSLSKLALGLFTVDTIAKTLGFGSALEVVGKASDAVSGALRGIFTDGGLLGGIKDASDSVRELREEIEKLEAARHVGEYELPGTTNTVNVRSFLGTRYEQQAKEAVLALRETINREITDAADETGASAQFIALYSGNDKAINAVKTKIAENIRQFEETIQGLQSARKFDESNEKALQREKQRAEALKQSADAAELAAKAEWKLRLARGEESNRQARGEAVLGSFVRPFFYGGVSAIGPALQEQERRANGLAQYQRALAEIERKEAKYKRQHKDDGKKQDDEGVLFFDRLSPLLEQQNRIRSILYDGLSGTERLATAARGVGEAFGTAFEEAILSGKKFSDILSSLGTDIERLLLRSLFIAPLVNSITGGLAGAFGVKPPGGTGGLDLPAELGANGLVFNHGSIERMAYGGLFSGPTYIPLRGGRGAIAGEAGPEAAVPLIRTRSGHLGVRTAGAGGGVNIIVYTKDADSFRRSTRQIAADVKRSF
jgi:hypothetical protein